MNYQCKKNKQNKKYRETFFENSFCFSITQSAHTQTPGASSDSFSSSSNNNNSSKQSSFGNNVYSPSINITPVTPSA